MVARLSSAPWSGTVRSWDAVARDLIRSTASWRVHSVFARAVNLVSPAGKLLGVVVAPAGNGPAMLIVRPTDRPVPLTLMVWPGDIAAVDGQRLAVADRLLLDLATAELWAPPPITRTLSADEILGRCALAVDIAATCAPKSGLAALLPEALGLSSCAGAERPDCWERGHPFAT